VTTVEIKDAARKQILDNKHITFDKISYEFIIHNNLFFKEIIPVLSMIKQLKFS